MLDKEFCRQQSAGSYPFRANDETVPVVLILKGGTSEQSLPQDKRPQMSLKAVHLRWDKGYEACCLEDIPHKRLTNPAKALRFGFETNAMPYSRDNIIRLDVIESGHLNAIAFWFDLELDQHCTVTTGAL